MKPGEHAVVVGASSKIGGAVARALSAGGLTVTGLSRSGAAAAHFARTLAADVTSDTSVDDALRAAAAVAPIDVLVYAAGVPAMGRTMDVPMHAARASFEVNFWGLERCVRGVFPAMCARRRGSILAVLSLAAVRAVPHEAYYAAAKAAAARYLECLAHEAARSGVKVHYVAPGFIDTGFFDRAGWFGMEAPRVRGSGVSPDGVASVCIDLLASHRTSQVVGWRERGIVLADRALPGLYDRWLRRKAPRG